MLFGLYKVTGPSLVGGNCPGGVFFFLVSLFSEFLACSFKVTGTLTDLWKYANDLYTLCKEGLGLYCMLKK